MARYHHIELEEITDFLQSGDAKVFLAAGDGKKLWAVVYPDITKFRVVAENFLGEFYKLDVAVEVYNRH